MRAPRARNRRTARALAPLLARPRYEVLPVRGVLEETGALPEHTVVTVTASPRRGTGATVELCEKLAAQRLRPVPHLAARQITGGDELAGVLDRLAGSGVDEVFVVGGDATEPAGPYPDGLALLRGMAELGRLPASVGVAAYPEGHPVIDDEALWSSLLSKQDYASYVVTQLCFDPDAIATFLSRARERDVRLPVVVGVPGAVDPATLARVGARIGVGDSLRFVTAHHSLVRRLLRPAAGRDAVLRGLADLMSGSAPSEASDRVGGRRAPVPAGLHFYTFNRVRATARLVTELSDAPREGARRPQGGEG